MDILLPIAKLANLTEPSKVGELRWRSTDSKAYSLYLCGSN